MARPDVILFDVMDTLVHDPFHEIPTFFGLTTEALLDAKHPSAWVEFEHGRLDEAGFLERFFADGRAYDHAGFLDAMVSGYRFLDGVEPLLAELHARAIPMHALSNYPRWYRRIEARLGLSRFLAWSFVSCETGVRKPDLEAYLGAARALELSPSRCLFVDDRERNCAAARAVGMDAIRFEGADSLREELSRRGLLDG